MSGEVDAQDRARLALDADDDDLAAAETLLDALPARARQPRGAARRLRGQRAASAGRWGGTLDWPVFEGRFEGDEIGYGGVDWGRARWAGSFDTAARGRRRRTRSSLRRAAAEIEWDGRTEIGWFGAARTRSPAARASTAGRVEDLVRFMEWDVAASGRVERRARSCAAAAARPRARRGSPRATARYYGIAYDEARLESRWKGRASPRSRAARRASAAAASTSRGSVTDDGVYDGSARWRTSTSARSRPRRRPASPTAAASPAELLLQGTLTRPRARRDAPARRACSSATRASARSRRASPATGDGRVALDGRCRSRARRPRARRARSAPRRRTRPTSGSTARSTSVDPFLRVVQPALPAALALVASGEARHPRAARAAGRARGPRRRCPSCSSCLPEFAVRASEPVRLSYAGGRLDARRAPPRGRGHRPRRDRAAPTRSATARSRSRRAGRADLRVLAVAHPAPARAAGDARLARRVSGTRAAPRVAGTLELEGAGPARARLPARRRGPARPRALQRARGRARGRERHARRRARSRSRARPPTPGGRLSLVRHPARPAAAWRCATPRGCAASSTRELRLFGDADAAVDHRHGRRAPGALHPALRRRLGAARGCGARSRAPQAASLEAGARLDLRVRAPGTLRIDNNLATLAARADARAAGHDRAPRWSPAAPRSSAAASTSRAAPTSIQRGTLDFVNPQRLDPLFDIEAVTRIRSYQVTLRVSGTLERVTPTLTSDPPLSSLQILALLAGQDESEVANLTQTQARQSQAQLAAAGAATLAAGRISESMGLEREAERLFGLNRFSIDPSLLRGAGTTRPRASRSASA